MKNILTKLIIFALAVVSTAGISAVSGSANSGNKLSSSICSESMAAPDSARVPVIMYHRVSPERSHSGRYTITPCQLERDFEYLKKNGYNTITVKDLVKYVNKGRELPENPIILTFDDGNSSDYKYLFPLLQKYDMKAVVSIIGKTTDEYTTQRQKIGKKANFPHMCWDMVIEMSKSGLVEIQSHSYDLHGKHGAKRLKGEDESVYKNRLKSDLEKLQRLMKEKTGVTPNAFIYPLGAFSPESMAALDELGFAASFSCTEGINIITRGNSDCLFMLKRNIRTQNRSIEAIVSGFGQ